MSHFHFCRFVVVPSPARNLLTQTERWWITPLSVDEAHCRRIPYKKHSVLTSINNRRAQTGAAFGVLQPTVMKLSRRSAVYFYRFYIFFSFGYNTIIKQTHKACIAAKSTRHYHHRRCCQHHSATSGRRRIAITFDVLTNVTCHAQTNDDALQTQTNVPRTERGYFVQF